MNKNKPISEIMTSKVYTLKITDSLDRAERLFKDHHIRHLPVLKAGELVGILSLTDLQRISFADTVSEHESDADTAVYSLLTVQQIMNHKVTSVESTSTIGQVASILGEKEFHALPVTENGKLVGIVTTTDLIRFLVNECQ